MKKLLQILMAPVLLAAVCLSVDSASAASLQCGNVTISNTGTNSNNQVVCRNNTDIVIECENDVDINVNNNQNSNSGNSTGNGNTTVGNVLTGNASNTADVDAAVAAACNEAKPATTNPPAGGQGGGAPAPAGGQGAGAPAADVKALPATGTSDVVKGLGIGAVVTGLVAAGAQLAVSGYRRFALK